MASVPGDVQSSRLLRRVPDPNPCAVTTSLMFEDHAMAQTCSAVVRSLLMVVWHMTTCGNAMTMYGVASVIAAVAGLRSIQPPTEHTWLPVSISVMQLPRMMFQNLPGRTCHSAQLHNTEVLTYAASVLAFAALQSSCTRIVPACQSFDARRCCRSRRSATALGFHHNCAARHSHLMRLSAAPPPEASVFHWCGDHASARTAAL